MRRWTSMFCIALACSVTLGLAGSAWPAPGQLISHTKISQANLPPLTLSDGDEFGDNVVGLGDLDGAGPGVAAIAVGSILDDDGGHNRGSVYIFFLNASGGILSQQKISQTQGNFTATLHDDDVLGTGLAWLGDLDGPGGSVGALAIGTINDDDGGAERGAVYICFLNSDGTVMSHTKISNISGGFTGALDNGDEFGGAICGLGDLDGDGPSAMAIAVGANRDDDGGFDRGAVWILYLNSDGTVRSHTKISSIQGMSGAITDTDGFGEKVANLGDLDGPGPAVVTLASSSCTDDDGGNDRGAVYVIFLNSDGGVLSYQKISNTAGNFGGFLMDGDSFGAGLGALGDLDGPGSSAGAIAVGASNADGLGFDRGTIFTLLLDNAGSVISYEEISSSTGTLDGAIHDTDELGGCAGWAGDIDGPSGSAGVILAGVGMDDDGALDAGAVYLLYVDGENTPLAVQPPASSGLIGVSRVRPNPFRTGTNVSFRLSEAGRVKLDVFDPGGRLVRRLVDRQDGPGDGQVTWNGLDDSGRALATGCYLIRMTVNGRVLSRAAKAVLLR